MTSSPNPLDLYRIVERTDRSQPPGTCISAFSRCFNATDIETDEHFDVNCRSWRCPKHRQQWGKKWATIIKSQLEATPCTLLVNLTTSEMIDYHQLEAALRFFIKRFRNHFGPTEYVKVVEYNKRKTQPHFHLLFICPELNLPVMPARFRSKTGRKLSWPEPVFEWLKEFWEEALAFAAPLAKATTVVWCQPPTGEGQAAAVYAIGYITGYRNQDKNEEPTDT